MAFFPLKDKQAPIQNKNLHKKKNITNLAQKTILLTQKKEIWQE